MKIGGMVSQSPKDLPQLDSMRNASKTAWKECRREMFMAPRSYLFRLAAEVVEASRTKKGGALWAMPEVVYCSHSFMSVLNLSRLQEPLAPRMGQSSVANHVLKGILYSIAQIPPGQRCGRLAICVPMHL